MYSCLLKKLFCALKVIEAKLFQLLDGRHLQEPWTIAISRSRCGGKAYIVVCGRSRLHGEDQTVAGVFGEGTSTNHFAVQLLIVLFLGFHGACYAYHAGEKHREAWVLAGCAESCAELHVTCDGATDHHVFAVL